MLRHIDVELDGNVPFQAMRLQGLAEDKHVGRTHGRKWGKGKAAIAAFFSERLHYPISPHQILQQPQKRLFSGAQGWPSAGSGCQSSSAEPRSRQLLGELLGAGSCSLAAGALAEPSAGASSAAPPAPAAAVVLPRTALERQRLQPRGRPAWRHPWRGPRSPPRRRGPGRAHRQPQAPVLVTGFLVVEPVRTSCWPPR